ncbi:MAG: Na/Pi cotransporter family protein [Gammaproteobacteria bacterium]|nr:Na/Pi cotransporter family protein [Gammaproteobacteria bacterium]
MEEVSTLDLGVMFTQLGGGLALFLYGMRRMTESLKIVAGNNMKNLLARLTANRFAAAFAGTVVTAVIQSSSVTTVLVVGFVSAGLLTVSQSIGVILGANVGTTITAQIVAFAIYKYGLLLIAAGFFTEIMARRARTKQWAMAVMGLGLIFFGMELMSMATGPLRQWPPFLELMQNMRNPLLTIAIGALFTAIVQSSSATTGIVIVFASQGLISLEAGIGLIFGANLGTCATAFLSTIGRPRVAVQAAWAHLAFNVGGVLLWVFFIPEFADAVRGFSPSAGHLQGTERLAADTPRQIANAHTLFNITNLFIFIWFTGPLARLVQRIAPLEPEPESMQPMYLDDLYLEQPALALDQAHRELERVGGMVRKMIGQQLHVAAHGTEDDADALTKADDDVDALYEDIIVFFGKLSQRDLVAKQPQELARLIGIANYFENIGDIISKDLVAILHKRASLGLTLSQPTLAVLEPIEQEVCRAFDKMLSAFESGDTSGALDAIESKAAVNELATEAASHLAKRLVADAPSRFETFEVETDIIDILRRVNTYTRRISRLIVDNTESEEAAAQ